MLLVHEQLGQLAMGRRHLVSPMLNPQGGGNEEIPYISPGFRFGAGLKNWREGIIFGSVGEFHLGMFIWWEVLFFSHSSMEFVDFQIKL